MLPVRNLDCAFPYPIIENDIEGDPTPKDQAIYVPSISAGYAFDALGRPGMRAIPSHLPANILNFLDQSNTNFRLSHALASAGQFLNRSGDNMISTRDRRRTRIIGDSGGYQVAHGKLVIGSDADRMRILRWLEAHSDIAMTLDIPPGGIGKPNFLYKTVEQCLEATLTNLAYFDKNRRETNTIFLNVIQGNTAKESIRWYRAVRDYPFEGWAIAGPLRNDIYHMCRLIIMMHQNGDLDGKKWIHVLGTNELGTAVMLTALQRAVKQHLNHNIRFSFDTATPFRLLAGNQLLGLPRMTEHEMKITQVSSPAGPQLHNKKICWPWPSSIGDVLYMDDVIVPGSVFNTTQRDVLGNHFVALHSLQALCFAIFNANRLFDVELITGKPTIGLKEATAAAAIHEIMKKPTLHNLEKYVSDFNGLRKEYTPWTADEDRDLD